MSDERLDELFRLIVRGEHPAVSADRRWRRLLTTWQVFEGNFAELIELVGAYEEDPRVHMRVMYEPPVGDLEYRERFFDELTRRWHNYVGSAMTYLDHERVFIAQESEGFAEAVRARYAATLEVSPAVHFTRKLRNFIMHVGWPPSQATMKFTQDSASHHILLSSERLQETRFRWSRLAREYMDSKPDEFPLTDSLSDFALELGAFHDWLRDRYWDEHRALTEGYEASVAEYESLGGGLRALPGMKASRSGTTRIYPASLRTRNSC